MELGGVGRERVEGAWPPSCMRPKATAMFDTGALLAMAAMLTNSWRQERRRTCESGKALCGRSGCDEVRRRSDWGRQQ